MNEIDPTQVHLLILTVLGPITAAAVIAWIKSKTKCLDKIDKRSFRQSQALIVMAQEIDKQTNHAHPDDTPSELAKTVEKLLKDEKGDL
jgi:hypothetical protein